MTVIELIEKLEKYKNTIGDVHIKKLNFNSNTKIFDISTDHNGNVYLKA